MLSAVVDFLLRMIWLHWGSIELHLTARSQCGSALQMCLPAAEQHRSQHAACFLTTAFHPRGFRRTDTKRRPSTWRAQTMNFGGQPWPRTWSSAGSGCRAEGAQGTKRGRGKKRKRPEEEMSGKELEGVRLWRTEPHWDLCHVPLRSKQRREMGRGDGENKRTSDKGRGCKISRVRVEWNSREWFLPSPPG